MNLKCSWRALIVTSGLFASSDDYVFGQTWARTGASDADWYFVASSADGSKLAASAYGGTNVYTSTNSGVAWRTNFSVHFGPLVSSADGTRLAMATADAPVYTSTDSGMTWTSRVFSSHEIAISADGSILAISGSMISTNSGTNWLFHPGNPNGIIGLSADGTRLVVVNAANLYTSTNMGVNWTSNSVPDTNIWAIALSADGTRLVVVEHGYDSTSGLNKPGPIYVTTNSGVSWLNADAPSNYWVSVAASADGQKMVAAALPIASNSSPVTPYYPGCIYTSTNGGVNWMSNNVIDTNWHAVASSADGGKLVAVGSGGIYTAYTAPTPQLNLAPAGDNLILSWVVTSTNVVLQQNTDLTTTNWSDTTDIPILNFTSLQNQVTLSPADRSGFFRLKSK